jgi:hypothetical protein
MRIALLICGTPGVFGPVFRRFRTTTRKGNIGGFRAVARNSQSVVLFAGAFYAGN